MRLANRNITINLSPMSSFMLLPSDQYAESTKTDQEIKQLIMPDQGSTEKNMIFIMTRGHPLQRPYVYKSFTPFWKDLLPYIISLVPDDLPQNHILATESIVKLFKDQRKALAGDTLDKIFSLAMSCINRQNWNVNQKWGTVLEGLLEIRCSPQNLSEIERMISQLGRSNQPIISRVTAGRLIGIICQYIKKLKPSMIDALKGILSYSQPESKMVWLKEIFPKLLRHCEFSFLEVHLQEKLMETVYDKNQDVGMSALELIMKNCQKFSNEEKENRIIKLFVQAITSRDQRVVVMITKIMGEIYQKLQHPMRLKENINVTFWEALMELSQSKNSAILNNFLYNLPGILRLSKSFYNIEPISEVYIGLFYENVASKPQLLSCLHQMIEIFPSKRQDFKQIIYDMFEEALDDDEQDCDQILNVIDIFLRNFDKVTDLFLDPPRADKEPKLQEPIIRHLMGYWGKIQKKRNGNIIENFHSSLSKCVHLVSYDHIQLRLVPKFFSSLKCNLPFSSLIVESLVECLHQITGNLNFISGYISKFFIEFGKSIRSFQREIAVRFLTSVYSHFSFEVIRQLKLADKVFYFANDRSFKVRYAFVSLVPKIKYHLNKEETVQFDRIVREYSNSRDQLIKQYVERHRDEFVQDESVLEEIKQRNNMIRQSEKEREFFLPQRKILGRRESLLKEHRTSIKDESLKLHNKKKLILNQLATLNRPSEKEKGPSGKKKFKISSVKQLLRKA